MEACKVTLHESASRGLEWWECLQKVLDELTSDHEHNVCIEFLDPASFERLRRAVVSLMKILPFPNLMARPSGVNVKISLAELSRAFREAAETLKLAREEAADEYEEASLLFLSSELLKMQAEVLRLELRSGTSRAPYEAHA